MIPLELTLSEIPAFERWRAVHPASRHLPAPKESLCDPTGQAAKTRKIFSFFFQGCVQKNSSNQGMKFCGLCFPTDLCSKAKLEAQSFLRPHLLAALRAAWGEKRFIFAPPTKKSGKSLKVKFWSGRRASNPQTFCLENKCSTN